MAYLANAFAPERSGLAAVWYEGAGEPRLSGLSAIAYDNGGRVRVLLGQDPSEDLPPDVGIDPALTNPLPIDLQPVTPAPSFLPFIPSPTVDTTSTPVTGSLVPAAQQPANITNSALTSILNAAKTIIPLATGASTGQTTPQTAGTVITTGPGANTSLTSSLMAEAPTIAIVAGVAIFGLILMKSFSGGGSGSGRSRRRNPMELILMGANPRYGRRRRY